MLQRTTLAGRLHTRDGFTLIEIMVVVLIIGVLMAIAMPNYIRARQNSQKTACTSHLRHLQNAKERWCMEEKRSNTDTPQKADLYPVFVKTWPACPSGGTYSLNQVGTPVTCSVGGTHQID